MHTTVWLKFQGATYSSTSIQPYIHIFCIITENNPTITFTALEPHLKEINQKWSKVAKYILLFQDTVFASMADDVSNRIKKFYSSKELDMTSITKVNNI